jgi:hypothetical protein
MPAQKITFIMLYVSCPPAGLLYGNLTLTSQFSLFTFQFKSPPAGLLYGSPTFASKRCRPDIPIIILYILFLIFYNIPYTWLGDGKGVYK